MVTVSRTVTIVAAVVLAFDGAALTTLGWWSGRDTLAIIGVIFFASSGLVLLYWRSYRRKLDDIAAARRELGEDVREMRKLLRSKD